jgi:hypothetical protein
MYDNYIAATSSPPTTTTALEREQRHRARRQSRPEATKRCKFLVEIRRKFLTAPARFRLALSTKQIFADEIKLPVFFSLLLFLLHRPIVCELNFLFSPFKKAQKLTDEKI